MRILAISDKASSALYRPNLNALIGPIDVLIGCGDLPYGYMDCVLTQTHVHHALFVHGNHDGPQTLPNGTTADYPGGWVNADRRVVYLKDLDLLVAGLEGSIQYSSGAAYQYTEYAMARRALKLIPQLLLNRVMRGRYLDILITHAPAEGIHDSPEGAHKGFRAFLKLMQRFEPRLFLHGHIHRYGTQAWHTQYKHTDVVNVYPFCMITYEGDTIAVNNRRLSQLPNDITEISPVRE